ncbi:hypothetical protein K1719_032660 [Acacia pycnantha]|nr:hypothetical protein K1719_032660 [Acacia pycnantha]
MEEIHISSSLVWKEVEAEKVLIGKILTSKSHTRSTLLSILRKACNLQEVLDIVEITGKAFMFKFDEDEGYNRILRGHLWSINGCLLNLMERQRYFRNFLRVRVMLDLRKPLAHRFWLPKPDGRNVWISVRYEKLQKICYTCSKIDHDNRDCNCEKLTSGFNPNEPRFGAWLATNVCRSWDETFVVEGKNDSSEEVEDLFFIKTTNPGPKIRRKDLGKAWKSGCLKSEGIMNPDLTVMSGARCMRSGMNKSKAPLNDIGGETESRQSNKGGLESRKNLKAHEVNSSAEDTSTVKSRSSPEPWFEKNRSAVEDWDSVELKRRRLNVGGSSPIPDISAYASNLRKIKARIRRSARKKDRGGKENIPEEKGQFYDEMEEYGNPNTAGSTFTFKVGSGKRKRMVADGWPLSATKFS